MASRRERRRARPAAGAGGGSPRQVDDLARLLLVFVAVVSLVNAGHYAAEFRGIDFFQFWMVARALSGSEQVDVYSAEGRERVRSAHQRRVQADGASVREREAFDAWEKLETTGSPLLYSVFRVFAADDYDASYHRYRFFSLLCMIGSCLGLCFLLRYSLAATLAAFVLLIHFFEPFHSEMRVANVNSLQLALLVLYLWTQSRRSTPARELGSGAILGFALLFKPNLAFAVGTLGMYWIFSGQLRKLRDQCLGMAIGAAAALAISGLSFGSLQPWLDWPGAAFGLPDAVIDIEEGNYALSMLIYQRTGVRAETYLAPILVALTALLFWRALRPVREAPALESGRLVGPDGEIDRSAVALAIGGLLYLMAGRLVWIHYYLLTIPAVLVALRPRGIRRGRRAARADSRRRWIALLALVPLARTPVLGGFVAEHIQLTVALHFALASVLYALMIEDLGPRRETGVQ